MDMGIRAMIPATENRQARGMAKISAYGARNPARRPCRGPRRQHSSSRAFPP